MGSTQFHHSFFFGMFHYQKPSSYWGTPMTMENLGARSRSIKQVIIHTYIYIYVDFFLKKTLIWIY